VNVTLWRSYLPVALNTVCPYYETKMSGLQIHNAVLYGCFRREGVGGASELSALAWK
jgi:hypothetical protein